MNVLNSAEEKLRLKLLQEEFTMRKGQPTAWTKTKYRPYANFNTKKKKKAT
ncbi:MAG: hypothetical protein ABIE23_06405 [archaeon]